MIVDVLSRSAIDAQTAAAVGPPKNEIRIVGQRPGELQEPRNLIIEAIKVLTRGRRAREKSDITALKASGLLTSAALKAGALRDWSTDGSYDPLPDHLILERLARTNLPALRGPKHPISLLRLGIAGAIKALREPRS